MNFSNPKKEEKKINIKRNERNEMIVVEGVAQFISSHLIYFTIVFIADYLT